jgi:hypothetical protein
LHDDRIRRHESYFDSNGWIMQRAPFYAYRQMAKLAEILDMPEDQDLFTVSWNLSDVCNYKCAYCEEELNGGRNKFPELKNIQGFIAALERATVGKKVVFDLKGGEPTLWRELPALVDQLRGRGWQSVVVTNGSRRPDWWRENGGRFDIVVLSFHPGAAKIEHFVDVIKILGERAMCGVLVAMEPARFSEGQEAVRLLRDTFPALGVTPIVLAEPGSHGKMYDYTPEQKAWLANPPPGKKIDGAEIFRHFENPSARGGREKVRVKTRTWLTKKETVLTDDQLKVQGLNRFKGWTCTAGLSRLHIETDGGIFRGQCRAGDQLGTIYDEELVIRSRARYCRALIARNSSAAGNLELPRPASRAVGEQPGSAPPGLVLSE